MADQRKGGFGLFGTAFRRIENVFRGKPHSERLIGTDIPDDVQEWEAMSEEEREEAIRRGRTPPKGAQL